MNAESQPPKNGRTWISSGNAAFDDILGGKGFVANHVYLIEGTPGAGKTTLALQFLLEGVKRGEQVLYVTLSETKEELRSGAKSHGWSLDEIHIHELIDPSTALEPETQYTMFQPSEVELNETTQAVLREIERINPTRVVFDSLSEMRLLAQNSLRYRRQILALKHFFAGRKCTVLLLDDLTSDAHDLQLQSIVHGVVQIEQLAPEYGAERRRLRVTKLRGVKYRGGYHDFVIATGGLRIFPRLVAAEHLSYQHDQVVPSGIASLDEILGGGVHAGSSVLLMGPAGVGKSSLAVQYAVAAAERGQNAHIFAFDESREILLKRSAGLGMPLEKHIQSGRIVAQQVDPAELSPGEFASLVRTAAEGSSDRLPAKVIVIDSLNGYLNAMPEERFLTIQLHELLSYLAKQGVVTFLVLAQHGLVGSISTPVDTSYLADVVILFRYFEAQGVVRQAISVVKKRSGPHERTVREISMNKQGLQLGKPLVEFQGILRGDFTYHGSPDGLLRQE
jgi:circadian clock protein KaiC